MKTILAIFVCCTLTSFATTSAAQTDEVTRELNGSWVVKVGTMAGNKLDASLTESMKLTIKENKFETKVGSISESGELVMDTSKKPMTMDIVIKEGPNKGKTLKCIFKLENGELTVCYAIQGDRPDKFESTSTNQWLVVTYKKQKGERPKR